MTETYQAVFDILKALLVTKTDIEMKYTKEQWRDICREMCAQSVDPLILHWLDTHPLPDMELYTAWLENCLQSLTQWVRVMHGQDELLKLLDENQIKCVIIKGAAAAMAYPYPSLRAAGDVDFLVKREDYERTAEVLENNGYQVHHEKNPEFHHYSYEKDEIDYELHRRLGIISEKDEELLAMFETGIDNREYRTIEDFRFPVLPTELNGLVLLFHINQHLRSGLGLRHIIDWMMYLEQNNGMEQLMPVLQKTGMEKFANTVTVMGQKYLGFREYAKDDESYPVDELMEYIMDKGNFGRKMGIEGKTQSVFLDITDPFRFFRRLQAGGMCNWQAAKKHVFLRPFAWIYQIGHISKELTVRRITPKKLLQGRSVGLQQRELIYRLGLDVERTINVEDDD